MSPSIFVKIFLLIFVDLSNSLSYQDIALTLANIPEDGRLNFCQLIDKYIKKKCTQHIVTTKDGYNLKLFNVEGDKSKPLFVQHGLLDSSDAFAILGHDSWAALLSNNSYDVWYGNTRGNYYSRSHISLNPDKDKQFWEYSFHELAIYDIPAMIDFILDATNQTQLQVVCHSQGTTVFFALGSLLPEYNHKVKTLICLSPVAFMHHALSPLGPLVSAVQNPIVSSLLGTIARGEFLSNSSVLGTVMKIVCTQGLVGRELCNDALFSVLFGYDPEQLDEETMRKCIGHFPAGSSLRSVNHYVQILMRKKFAAYDFGPLQNLKIYNSTEPPDYDLSKCNMKIILIAGQNDNLSAKEDVQLLWDRLPNVVDFHQIEYEKWNHLDFVWGKYLPIYVYPYVILIL